MDKIKLGYRVHWHQLNDDKGFEYLLEFLEKYKDQIDEMALFSHYSLQSYIPPEEDEEICQMLKKRMDTLRERGFKNLGICMLATIGHGDEDYAEYPLPNMVGHDGSRSRTTACPTSKEFKEYISERYKKFARINPDHIWADDDNRFYHCGVLYPCFCERCMGIFNERHGYNYTRETLVADMEVSENVELRGRWVQFVEDRIADTFATIEKAVHEVNPDIELGYMSTLNLDDSFITYNGMNWDHWLTALKATKGRPGTTIFHDRTPMDLLTKPMLVGFQLEDYPDDVTDIVYEHENYPYPTYRKSHVMETSECTLALASGASGLYINTTDDRNLNIFGESEPFFDIIRKKRAAWDAINFFSKKNPESKGYGFFPGMTKNFDKLRPLHFGESFFQEKNGWRKHNYWSDSSFLDIRNAFTMGEIGVPLTCDRKNSIGTILCGDLSDSFTDEEIKEIFSGPVLMDGYSLRALERRGLGYLTGVKLDRVLQGSYHERLNKEDPVNFGIANDYRDIREYPADYGGYSGSITLEPLNDNVRIVTYMEHFKGQHEGVAMTLYENELGGRVCVMGYAAYTMVDSLTRRIQIANVCEWLTKGQMLSKILTNCLAGQYVRTVGNKTMITIASFSLDGITAPEIAVRGATKATFLGDNGNFFELEVRKEGDYGVFTMPDILAFATATVITE